MKCSIVVAAFAALALTGCMMRKGQETARFGDDLAFLQQHTDVVVLSDKAGQAQVAVVPKYQGRVMTSTATGPEGLSYGWLNRELIAKGERLPHMNPFGGEERMWLGPEGGQFSIFFKKGDTFDLAHWQTPEVIDWGGWDIASAAPDAATFRKTASLVSYSGTTLDVALERTVRLLSVPEARMRLGSSLGRGVQLVAYESVNRLTNTGKEAWEKSKGLLSIWILCMYNPSPDTTVVVPFNEGPEDTLGRVVNDAYFGKVPADRLVVKGGTIFFKADGTHRGKIGVGPKRAKSILGSYDAANRVLTLAQFTFPEGVTDYVNSMWEIQKEPYAGDVANSYNDGPAADGKMLGPFYEIESSSPAAYLVPGQTLTHVHRTFHLQGPRSELDRIAKAALGVGLDEIESAFQGIPPAAEPAPPAQEEKAPAKEQPKEPPKEQPKEAPKPQPAPAPEPPKPPAAPEKK